MGDMADDLRWFDELESDYPSPEDYLDMTDDQLRMATSGARTEKLKSIRRWNGKLTPKQRYCLAAWLAERDAKYG